MTDLFCPLIKRPCVHTCVFYDGGCLIAKFLREVVGDERPRNLF